MGALLIIFIIIPGIWCIVSALIYCGFYALQFFTLIPANRVLDFKDAMDFGEMVAIALIIAAIVCTILHKSGIIDLTTLLSDNDEKE